MKAVEALSNRRRGPSPWLYDFADGSFAESAVWAVWRGHINLGLFSPHRDTVDTVTAGYYFSSWPSQKPCLSWDSVLPTYIMDRTWLPNNGLGWELSIAAVSNTSDPPQWPLASPDHDVGQNTGMIMNRAQTVMNFYLSVTPIILLVYLTAIWCYLYCNRFVSLKLNANLKSSTLKWLFNQNWIQSRCSI